MFSSLIIVGFLVLYFIKKINDNAKCSYSYSYSYSYSLSFSSRERERESAPTKVFVVVCYILSDYKHRTETDSLAAPGT